MNGRAGLLDPMSDSGPCARPMDCEVDSQMDLIARRLSHLQRSRMPPRSMAENRHFEYSSPSGCPPPWLTRCFSEVGT